MRTSTTSSHGFTLIEMMISLTLGLIVVAAAVQSVQQRDERDLADFAAGRVAAKCPRFLEPAEQGHQSGGRRTAHRRRGAGFRDRPPSPIYGCDYTGACLPGTDQHWLDHLSQSGRPGQRQHHQLPVRRDPGMEAGSHSECRRRSHRRNYRRLCWTRRSCSATTP